MKLKAWKVAQQSLFYYSQWQAGETKVITIGMKCTDGLAFVLPDTLELCTEQSDFPLSAYTVAEMMAMIGFKSASAVRGEGETRKFAVGFHIATEQPFTEHLTKPLAEALGDLLLFRIEKGQITVKDANERLLILQTQA